MTTTPITPHCESCGRENPGTDEGYTGCCNELVCGGRDIGMRYGTDDDNKRACCWAKANEKFAAEGRRAPTGSYRIDPRRH